MGHSKGNWASWLKWNRGRGKPGVFIQWQRCANPATVALYRVMVDSSASSLEGKPVSTSRAPSSSLILLRWLVSWMRRAEERELKSQWTPESVWLALLSLTVMASVSSVRSVWSAEGDTLLAAGSSSRTSLCRCNKLEGDASSESWLWCWETVPLWPAQWVLTVRRTRGGVVKASHMRINVMLVVLPAPKIPARAGEDRPVAKHPQMAATVEMRCPASCVASCRSCLQKGLKAIMEQFCDKKAQAEETNYQWEHPGVQRWKEHMAFGVECPTQRGNARRKVGNVH